MATGAGCLDYVGNPIACSDPSAYSDMAGNPLSGSQYIDPSTGMAETSAQLSQANNPVAASAGTSSGGTAISGIFTSLLNFGSTVTSAVVAPSSTSGLKLQINPATGQQQYFNPTTGQYIGGPVGNTSLLGGSNSFLLVIVALVVAFFAFGGKKAVAAA